MGFQANGSYLIVCKIRVCYDSTVVKRKGHRVSLQIKRGLKFPYERRWLTAICRTVLDEEKIEPPVDVECIVTDDETIRALNRQFRKIDEPTDVLSFAFKDSHVALKGEAFPMSPDIPEMLGQIVVSFPRTIEQARMNHCSPHRELIALIVHGMLHLLGYDHQIAADARKMKRREEQIINRIDRRALPA